MSLDTQGRIDPPRWRSLPSEAVVAIALSELAGAGREVVGLIAHLPRSSEVEPILTRARELLPDDGSGAIECNVTSAYDHAFVTLTRRRQERASTRIDCPIVSIQEAAPHGGTAPSDLSAARLTASPDHRSVYRGLNHDEFLLQLRSDASTGASACDDVGPAISLAASHTHHKRRPLWFVNGPAAPPSEGLRAPTGPFLRFAVTRLDSHEDPLTFAEELIDACAAAHLGLWVPDDRSGVGRQDYWRQILDTDRAPPPVPPERTRAITLVGPARPGMTALMVDWIGRDRTTGRPIRPILGLFMASFAGLAMINVLTTVVPERPIAGVNVFRPAHDVMTDLYGPCPGDDLVLDDDRIHVSDFAESFTATGAERAALWLTWSIGDPAPLEHLLPAATWAFQSALRRQDVDVRIDYLVCREESRPIVAGRAKVSVPRALLPDDPAELAETVDRIEQRWRDRIRTTAGWSRGTVRVAWRESWVRRTTGLHGDGPRR